MNNKYKQFPEKIKLSRLEKYNLFLSKIFISMEI